MDKLDGAEPLTGPKTIQLILKSCSTRKVETLKGVVITKPNSSLAPAKGNKTVSNAKSNSDPAGKLQLVKTEDDIPMSVAIKLPSSSTKDASASNTVLIIQTKTPTTTPSLTTPAPQDKWSRDKHIKLIIIVDFQSEVEPKKVSESLNHPGWVDAILEAIRIFLTFATYMNFIVYQMDITSAFLNGKLKEEFYVQQPLGFESSEFPNRICKLYKALYGLKQAPRAWYETLNLPY
ncbi:retrovirus-related pol polyprotein from transposon TNT 1-94 [Tanacetum coccineum]